MSDPPDALHSAQRLYLRTGRCHTFSALLRIPYVLWQSVIVILYLWHREIASLTHAELLRVAPNPAVASLEQQLDAVLKHHPAERLQTIEVGDDPAASTTFLFADTNGLSYPAFTNPHTGQYLGYIQSTHWLRGLS